MGSLALYAGLLHCIITPLYFTVLLHWRRRRLLAMYMKLLRQGPFVFLWLAQIASTLAVQLYKIGAVVVIFDQTGSTLQAAGVLVATSLPYVVIGQFAGALVDRYSRK